MNSENSNVVTAPVPTGAMNTEPSISVGTITGGVAAVITLLVAYGVSISSAQTEAILSVVAIIAPIIVGIVVRSKVYSPATVQRVANDVAETQVAEVPKPPATA